MAKDMTQEQLDFVADLKDAGTPWEQAFDACATKFNIDRPTYSQCWLNWASRNLTDADRIAPEGKAIAAARANGDSWGLIAVKAGVPESRVRKLFKEHTSIRSEGLRNGKGGRFLRDEEAYYNGEARFKGNAFAADRPIPSPAELAGIDTLLTRSLKELRAEAKSMGLDTKGAKTKADFALAISQGFTAVAGE